MSLAIYRILKLLNICSFLLHDLFHLNQNNTIKRTDITRTETKICLLIIWCNGNQQILYEDWLQYIYNRDITVKCIKQLFNLVRIAVVEIKIERWTEILQQHAPICPIYLLSFRFLARWYAKYFCVRYTRLWTTFIWCIGLKVCGCCFIFQIAKTEWHW